MLYQGRKPAVVVSSADIAREIMKTHDTIFANRPDSRIARNLLYDYKDFVFVALWQVLEANEKHSCDTGSLRKGFNAFIL